jgi:hypothetical protein
MTARGRTAPSSTVLVIGLALALGGCGGSESTTTYLITLGADTVGAEQLAVGPGAIEGRQIRSWPVAADIRFRAELNSDGTVARYAVHVEPAALDAAPAQGRSEIDFDGRSATLRVWNQGGVDTTVLDADAAPIPMLYPSALSHLLVARHLAAVGTDSLEVDLLGAGFDPPGRAVVRTLDAGSIEESWPAWGNWHYVLRHDGSELRSVNSDRTTERYLISRVDSLDLDRLWTTFTERQRAIGGGRPLSPLDTVGARLNGASITVEYSRPSRRGRAIFGSMEPWGRVWRTGAGFTTHFVTDSRVSIGGKSLAPGKYSLWTLPTPDSVTLIVNRQIDTWSVAYDSTLDVFRVPMARRRLDSPTELFTISLTPAAGSLGLRMEWEREQWQVDIRR